MPAPETNFDRLQAAGAVNPSDYSQGQVATINNDITADEVTELIRIRQKLGGGHMMPDQNPVVPNTSSF